MLFWNTAESNSTVFWVQLHSVWNTAESNSTVFETQLSPTPQWFKYSWVQLHSFFKHSWVQLHSVWNTAESNSTVFETQLSPTSTVFETQLSPTSQCLKHLKHTWGESNSPGSYIWCVRPFRPRSSFFSLSIYFLASQRQDGNRIE